MDEDDVGTYTIKCIDDPRALNKTIYLRPTENILSQNELIAKWENLSGKVLEKIPITSDKFLASMEGNNNTFMLNQNYIGENKFTNINVCKTFHLCGEVF
jgi:hypothetical protein